MSWPRLAPAVLPVVVSAMILAAVLAFLVSSAPLPAAGETPYGRTTVVVFSQTGNTLHLAQLIAAKTGGEVYLIESAEPLPTTEAELIAMEEPLLKADAPAALKSPPPDLSGRDLIFLGAPTWFGDRPRLVKEFLRQADFGGAKVAVFSTAGTRPGETINTLKSEVKNGLVLEPVLLQRRADDRTEAAVEKRVDDFLAAVSTALQP